MLFLASHRIADIVGKLANGQEFDSPLSSIYQKLSTKNIGAKRYLPHTYHEEMGDGWAGRKVQRELPSGKRHME